MTLKNSVGRYTGVAIALHWLIALLIISLLILGKFMTSLDEADPLRFSLTQWHKSFGITILLLTLARIIWRMSHKPPALPDHIRGWQKFSSGLTHFLIYFLMLGLPISGWIMVSASPLNLSTILFEVIPLPHLPVLASLANKAQISDLFHEVHAISSSIMIALLVLHIGAALMHQFVQRDSVMERMAPRWKSKETKEGLGLIAGCIGAVLLGLFLINEIRMHQDTKPAVTLTNGQNQAESKSISSQVSFKLVLMGEDIKGTFAESSVILNLDSGNPTDSSLSATVKTANANTSNPQINDSLPGSDWFDVAQHPEANFVSTEMEMTSETSWLVTGDLTLRETTKPVNFTLNLDRTENTAKGEFTINRLDYAVGAVEQADDSIAGLNVVIEFDFPIE